MTRPAPRFTIVRTLAGFHVRILAANGAKALWSEPYARVDRARRAIEVTCLAAGRAPSMAARVAKAAEVEDNRAAQRQAVALLDAARS